MSDFEKVLSDSGVPTTEDAMVAEFQQTLTDAGSQISNDSAYSPFWRVCRQLVIKPTMWLIQELLIKRVMPQFFLKTVGETWIDIWGDSYGVTRKAAATTQGRVLFSRVDTSAEQTIKAGTTIWTESINGSVYTLITTEDAVLRIGDESVFAKVQAENAGAAYNLEAGYYTNTDAEGFTVTNLSGWIDQIGADVEDIEAYRVRIRAAFNSLSMYHTDGVYRALISEFVGVDADKIWFEHDAPRGPGSANAFILFDLATPSASYIATINRMIMEEGYHGHGDDLKAFAMPETQHDLTATVFLPASLLSQERDEMLAQIGVAIESAFRANSAYVMTTTSPWSRFSFTRLASELYGLFPDVISIEFSIGDIVSEMSVPRLSSLSVVEG
ncbi:MAG: hypothetical protein DSY85_02185 [Marinomonas sp.]|nr:MAG: hypothetical protein DSY85_02185 [Marinomonas sp.]